MVFSCISCKYLNSEMSFTGPTHCLQWLVNHQPYKTFSPFFTVRLFSWFATAVRLDKIKSLKMLLLTPM